MMIAPSKSITVQKQIHYPSLLRPEDKKDRGMRIVGGWSRQTTLLTAAWALDLTYVTFLFSKVDFPILL
jgi:hypothetical protein